MRAEHIPQPVIVPEIIREVVAKVATTSGIAFKFYHDTPEQLEAKLLDKSNIQAAKYPAFALFHDFPEDNGGGAGGYYGIVTIPKIIIVALTKKELYADARYSKTFTPVLYPGYEWFKKKLAQHGAIVETDPSNFTHRKWDRLDWGTQPAGQELTDVLDAIEIQNLRLTLQQFR